MRAAAKASPGLKKVSSLASVFTELRAKPHFHTCSDRECRLIYEDRCTEPGVNGRCQACRGVRRAIISSRDPQECCINNCVQVTYPDALKRYLLAGPGPWYQCLRCRRASGWSCVM